MLEFLMGLPGWVGNLIAAAIGSIVTLVFQWLKHRLQPWESDRIRFEKIADAIDPVVLNDLAESIPTAIPEFASEAAHALDRRLRELEQERFFDRKLRKREAELRTALNALLDFQGDNFFLKHSATNYYTMAFDSHDEWDPEHARILKEKSSRHRELAKSVLAKWNSLNERGKRLFVGKVRRAK